LKMTLTVAVVSYLHDHWNDFVAVQKGPLQYWLIYQYD
jgi:hypothetical protein